MSLSAKYGYAPNKEAIDRQLGLLATELESIASEKLYKACFSIMDQTTLSSDDTPASVKKLVEKDVVYNIKKAKTTTNKAAIHFIRK